jgi:hypothetical protein
MSLNYVAPVKRHQLYGGNRWYVERYHIGVLPLATADVRGLPSRH